MVTGILCLLRDMLVKQRKGLGDKQGTSKTEFVSWEKECRNV